MSLCSEFLPIKAVFDTLGISAAKIALISEFFFLVKPHGTRWAGPYAHATADAVIRIDLDGAGLLIADQRAFLGGRPLHRVPGHTADRHWDNRRNLWKRSLP